MQYEVCKFCGANLDPGEKCDCQQEEQKKLRRIEEYIEEYFEKSSDGQMKFVL